MSPGDLVYSSILLHLTAVCPLVAFNLLSLTSNFENPSAIKKLVIVEVSPW
jgi:hypothetical protein